MNDVQWGGAHLPHESRKSIQFGPNFDLSDQARIAPKFVDGATLTPDTARRIEAQIESSRLWNQQEKYKRYMPVALAFAAMSKMPGTKVGCLILGDSFQTLSSGWNGAARGCAADEDERLDTRESRLDWVVHAEANAIAGAAMSGTRLEGGTMICTLMPCMACAKLIAQAGIERVVCPKPGEDMARWADQFALTRRLFEECDIDLVECDEP